MRSSHVSAVALAALSVSCIVQPPPGSPAYVPSATASFEVDTDRPGADYRAFDVASGRPEECRDTCMTEPQCAAFTFVNPDLQGPNARCFLKSTVPNPSPNAGHVSGVKNAAPVAYDQAPPPAAPPPAYEQAAPPPAAPPQQQWVGTPPPAAPPQPQWVGAPPPAPPPSWQAAPTEDLRGLERDTVRPGADYATFELREPRARLCEEACLRDKHCQAFTYSKPGAQGPSARCALKDRVPRAERGDCCVSGVKGESGVAAAAPPPPPPLPLQFELGHYEPNTDRHGADYRSFDVPEARPEVCREACLQAGQCRAFTYLRPNVHGPVARCFLKSSVPPSSPDSCCVSGTK